MRPRCTSGRTPSTRVVTGPRRAPTSSAVLAAAVSAKPPWYSQRSLSRTTPNSTSDPISPAAPAASDAAANRRATLQRGPRPPQREQRADQELEGARICAEVRARRVLHGQLQHQTAARQERQYRRQRSPPPA